MKKQATQKWFIVENGSQKGPLTPEIILELLEQKEVTLQTQLISEENPNRSISVSDLQKSLSDPAHTLFDALHVNKTKKHLSLSMPSKIASDPAQKMWVAILIAACCILTLFIIVLVRSSPPEEEEKNPTPPAPQDQSQPTARQPSAPIQEKQTQALPPDPPNQDSREPSNVSEPPEANREYQQPEPHELPADQ